MKISFFSNLAPQKFLDPAYIFEKTPPADSGYLYLTILFGLMMVTAGIVWFIYGRRKRKLHLYQHIQTKIFNLFFYPGLAGIVLVFFRWQQIAYLGSRFFMLLLLTGFLIWTIVFLNYYLRIFPRECEEYQQKKNFEKYLPRTK